MNKDILKSFVIGFGAILLLQALGLIIVYKAAKSYVNKHQAINASSAAAFADSLLAEKERDIKALEHQNQLSSDSIKKLRLQNKDLWMAYNTAQAAAVRIKTQNNEIKTTINRLDKSELRREFSDFANKRAAAEAAAAP